MKTADSTNIIVHRESSDRNPNASLYPVLTEESWDHSSGMENALRALLSPHCVFENTIFYRCQNDIYKISRTHIGWTDTTLVTDTMVMHEACEQMSNNIKQQDILALLGGNTCNA